MQIELQTNLWLELETKLALESCSTNKTWTSGCTTARTCRSSSVRLRWICQIQERWWSTRSCLVIRSTYSIAKNRKATNVFTIRSSLMDLLTGTLFESVLPKDGVQNTQDSLLLAVHVHWKSWYLRSRDDICSTKIPNNNMQHIPVCKLDQSFICSGHIRSSHSFHFFPCFCRWY